MPPAYAADRHERELLGVLLRSAGEGVASLGVCEDDFRDAGHRLVFRAVSRLVEHGRPADLAAVGSLLASKGRLDDAGGFDYLADLHAEARTGANACYHTAAVRDASLRRRLRDEGHRLAALADAGGPAAELLAEARSRLDALAARYAPTFAPNPGKDAPTHGAPAHEPPAE